MATVVSSAEAKALETADIVCTRLGLPLSVREAMHENDRSATGFLPPDAFFGQPNQSYCGWERAIDARDRIVAETEAVLATHGEGDLVFVGHGAVGTLLMCALHSLPISRIHDQPAGGGCVLAYDIDQGVLLHGWRRIEELAGVA